MLRQRWISAGFALALPFAALGASFHVAPSGSDANRGSVSRPWRTIAYGVSQLRGGDTLNIAPGRYDEAFEIPSRASGSSWSSPTTIRGTNVIVDAHPGAYQRNVIQCEAHYVVISGITVDMINYPTSLLYPSCFVMSSSEAHHVRLTNCAFLSAPRGMGVLITSSAGGYHEILSCVSSNHGWAFVGTSVGDTFYHPVYIETANNLVDGCTLGPPGIGARNHLDEARNCGLQIYEGTSLTNNTVRNCTIRGPSRVGFTVTGDPSGPVGVGGYNKFYNNTVSDVTYFVLGAYYSPSNSFYNNTVYNASYGVWINEGTHGDCGYNNIVNNIFVNVTNTVFGLANNSTSYLTNNLLYNCGTAFHPGSRYSEIGTLPEDPRFENPANGDFRLKEASPARNAGIDLSSIFSADKAGNPRPSGAWDVGAYQFVAPPPTNPLPGNALGISVDPQRTAPEKASIRSIPVLLSESGSSSANLPFTVRSSNR